MEPKRHRDTFPFLKINTKIQKSTEHLWEEIRSLGIHPSRRSYHSACVWRDKMLIYGGQNIQDGLQSGLWAYDLDNKNIENWEEFEIPGLVPLCRHSAIVKGDFMYIFGGTNGEKVFNDTWVIDINHRRVEKITSNPPDFPPPHDSHTATLFENGITSSMIVFGGFVEETRTNKIYTLDLSNFKWKLEDTNNGPEPRSNHTAVIYHNDLYIYGGSNNEGEKLDDFWRLKLDTFIWEIVAPKLRIPAGRSGHSAIVYKDIMVIFGGMKDETQETNEMYSYGFLTNDWTLFQNDHQVKDPVSAAQLEEYKQAHKSHLMSRRHTVNSNLNKKESLSPLTPKPRANTEFDVRTINVSLEGRVQGRAPHQRDGHSAVVYEDVMYIFGGDRHQMPFSDLYGYVLIEEELKTPVKIDN